MNGVVACFGVLNKDGGNDRYYIGRSLSRDAIRKLDYTVDFFLLYSFVDKYLIHTDRVSHQKCTNNIVFFLFGNKDELRISIDVLVDYISGANS